MSELVRVCLGKFRNSRFFCPAGFVDAVQQLLMMLPYCASESICTSRSMIELLRFSLSRYLG